MMTTDHPLPPTSTVTFTLFSLRLFFSLPYVLFAVPIQVQLQYSNLQGDQFLHSFTFNRPVRCQRTEAEEDLNSTVSALQAIHESARLAQTGKYTDARINLVSVQRLLQRTMKKVNQQKAYLSYIVQAEV